MRKVPDPAKVFRAGRIPGSGGSFYEHKRLARRVALRPLETTASRPVFSDDTVLRERGAVRSERGEVDRGQKFDIHCVSRRPEIVGVLPGHSTLGRASEDARLSQRHVGRHPIHSLEHPAQRRR